MLYQRDEFNKKRDSLSYPPIPEYTELQNQSYGYENPAIIHGYQWSTTFNRWSALVTMSNGWHGYTFGR